MPSAAPRRTSQEALEAEKAAGKDLDAAAVSDGNQAKTETEAADANERKENFAKAAAGAAGKKPVDPAEQAEKKRVAALRKKAKTISPVVTKEIEEIMKEQENADVNWDFGMPGSFIFDNEKLQTFGWSYKCTESEEDVYYKTSTGGGRKNMQLPDQVPLAGGAEKKYLLEELPPKVRENLEKTRCLPPGWSSEQVSVKRQEWTHEEWKEEVFTKHEKFLKFLGFGPTVARKPSAKKKQAVEADAGVENKKSDAPAQSDSKLLIPDPDPFANLGANLSNPAAALSAAGGFAISNSTAVDLQKVEHVDTKLDTKVSADGGDVPASKTASKETDAEIKAAAPKVEKDGSAADAPAVGDTAGATAPAAKASKAKKGGTSMKKAAAGASSSSSSAANHDAVGGGETAGAGEKKVEEKKEEKIEEALPGMPSAFGEMAQGSVHKPKGAPKGKRGGRKLEKKVTIVEPFDAEKNTPENKKDAVAKDEFFKGPSPAAGMGLDEQKPAPTVGDDNKAVQADAVTEPGERGAGAAADVLKDAEKNGKSDAQEFKVNKRNVDAMDESEEDSEKREPFSVVPRLQATQQERAGEPKAKRPRRNAGGSKKELSKEYEKERKEEGTNDSAHDGGFDSQHPDPSDTDSILPQWCFPPTAKHSVPAPAVAVFRPTDDVYSQTPFMFGDSKVHNQFLRKKSIVAADFKRLPAGTAHAETQFDLVFNPTENQLKMFVPQDDVPTFVNYVEVAPYSCVDLKDEDNISVCSPGLLVLVVRYAPQVSVVSDRRRKEFKSLLLKYMRVAYKKPLSLVAAQLREQNAALCDEMGLKKHVVHNNEVLEKIFSPILETLARDDDQVALEKLAGDGPSLSLVM
mmetsp:Transcript_8711/g.21110  ORF Transcript_8711/g.21110 Transcript_8711/m.21110 type:complete len:858 (+) Transcript_8711:185-2758(+)|eukprot:CAMPEP_0178988338 /NCGR_PEP_ID=MMETSP0795-20121207/3758_1 /TAXON_ID=88552 /ORGANISM="Amoebophrya sp., Strain Ameob2" /LENGTH=857 /DNA_ID=CAMNT_0020679607 /DNA_START=163 /DNA_END=2736 /DNA_ORIENTATION=+